MPHMCPSKGCKITVPDRLLMCGKHWHELRPAEKKEVYDSLFYNGPGLAHIQRIKPIIDKQAIRMNRGE